MRRFRALCADGKTRTARQIAEADSFFSLPCRVQVRGKTVTGFIWTDSNEVTCFSADAWRKNANLLKWDIPK